MTRPAGSGSVGPTADPPGPHGLGAKPLALNGPDWDGTGRFISFHECGDVGDPGGWATASQTYWNPVSTQNRGDDRGGPHPARAYDKSALFQAVGSIWPILVFCT